MHAWLNEVYDQFSIDADNLLTLVPIQKSLETMKSIGTMKPTKP